MTEMNQQESNCIHINRMLSNIFPDAFVHARVRSILSQPNVHLTFASKKSGWANNIILNDPAYMSFMIHVNTDGTAYIDHPTTHSSRVWHDTGMKFRKIKAPSEYIATLKLIEWFAKNHVAILSV
jgi:hypothetical protein